MLGILSYVAALHICNAKSVLLLWSSYRSVSNMKKHLLIIALIAAVLLIGLAGAVSAASVTVAASDSLVKNPAQYLCDGSSDQTEIIAAIKKIASSGGGDVILLDGTFTVGGDIILTSGVNLVGQGADSTTLNFVGAGRLKVNGNTTLHDFQTTGLTGIIIVGSHIKLTNITVRNYTSTSPAFYIYATNKVISDVTFTNCNAIDGSSYGFKNGGEGSLSGIADITYSGCSAINAGRASQADPMVSGFYLTTNTNITNMLVENCRAEGSWESGFYFGDTPQKNNVIIRDCTSINNGQKKARTTPSYGAGFVGGSSTMQFIDCTSQGNVDGFRLFDGVTVIRGKDIGSTNGYRTSGHGNIILTDCWSDQALGWAFYGLLSHDVTATNFKVTDPIGNPYPATLTGSTAYPSSNMNVQLVSEANPSSITVAASNSPTKDSAKYICDGSDDQVEIQKAVDMVAPGGGDVILLDGTFTLSGTINLADGVNLIGLGADVTTLTLVSVGGVSVSGNSSLHDFGMTGQTRISILGSHVKLTNITVRNYTSISPAFYVFASNEMIRDITFTNCNAIDGSSYGFKNSGEGSPNSISDITYSGCSVINAGRAAQASPWIVGFDLTETTDITNMLVENCRAEGSWESGFYFEGPPQKNNVTLINCVSIDNGQKKTQTPPTYGAGFVGGSSTMQFIDCTSQGNYVGFWLDDGATVIRGKDVGSVQAFRTASNDGNITLTDCWSDQAQQWAFYGLLSHDVTATNFKVTNPVGNPYPAVLAGTVAYPSYNMNIQLPDTSIISPQVPVAQFEASVTSGKAPLTVFFTDQSTGTLTSSAWKFGDGTTSSAKNPTHKYTTAGIFSVTEIVRNSAGSNTIVKTKYIMVT